MVEILTGEVISLIDDNISWYLESWSLSITLSRRKAGKQIKSYDNRPINIFSQS